MIEIAGHSEDLILRLVTEGNHSKENHDTIKRNIDHLNYILGKSEIIETNSPKLGDFRSVIELGENFISE